MKKDPLSEKQRMPRFYYQHIHELDGPGCPFVTLNFNDLGDGGEDQMDLAKEARNLLVTVDEYLCRRDTRFSNPPQATPIELAELSRVWKALKSLVVIYFDPEDVPSLDFTPRPAAFRRGRRNDIGRDDFRLGSMRR